MGHPTCPCLEDDSLHPRCRMGCSEFAKQTHDTSDQETRRTATRSETSGELRAITHRGSQRPRESQESSNALRGQGRAESCHALHSEAHAALPCLGIS